MLVFLLIFIDLTIPGNCVKCFFWPIYGLIYSIGIIFGIFCYLTRKTYRGIIICVEDIKELFTDMWYAGEDDD
jgi:prolipoprotein diacylglyceryltransferase